MRRTGVWLLALCMAACIYVDNPDFDGSTGAEDSSTSVGTSTSSTSVASSTSSSSSSSSTTTEAGSTGSSVLEQCDGVDNDGDGLIDEHSADNTVCGDCFLDRLAPHVYWFCSDADAGNDPARAAWDSAQQFCQSRGDGSWLASVTSQAENDFITGNLGEPHWLGGVFGDTSWGWTDGTPFEFEAFDGEPPVTTQGQVFRTVAGVWEEANPDDVLAFVCKARDGG